METVTRCLLCGVPRTRADERGLAWSSLHTADGVRWACGACTRASVTEIECHLPLGPVDLPATA